MTRHRSGRRAGFTLVELLVAIAIIVVLAAISAAVLPSIVEQDRTTDAAATIRQHLMIAKARATRENNGRGIRFILDSGLSDPSRLSGVDASGFVYGALLSTEMQYIEAAPTIVPNPLGLTGPNDAYVEFDPTTSTCTLVNLDPLSEAILVMQNDLAARWFPKLYCPVLGPDAFGRTQRFEILRLTQQGSSRNWTVVLDRQPHSLIGAGTTERVYRFAIEPRSRALLGEPNIPLPKNVCVDLNAFVSLPGARVVNGQPIDFEVMFAPSGQVVDPVSAGMIYLWVRDYTKTNPTTGKPLDMRPVLPNAGNLAAAFDYGNQFQFEIGGDQQLVAIKAKTGALGVFPVNWPNATGIYAAPIAQFGPYALATKDSSSP
ncbi:MAG: prepilin-type N-terminal cleavage/methylation domain-containing protein [Gemmataceae bacterium]